MATSLSKKANISGYKTKENGLSIPKYQVKVDNYDSIGRSTNQQNRINHITIGKHEWRECRIQ